MFCRITELHDKEVINVCDGNRLGCVDDVEVDTCSAKLTAIVIHGRPKLFGLLGHEDDLVIPWCEIEIIGEETVLVSRKAVDPSPRHRAMRGLLSGVFSR